VSNTEGKFLNNIEVEQVEKENIARATKDVREIFEKEFPPNKADFTFYLGHENNKWLPNGEKDKGAIGDQTWQTYLKAMTNDQGVDHSIEFSELIQGGEMRVQASKCFNGQAWALTVRAQRDTDTEPSPPLGDWDRVALKLDEALTAFTPKQPELVDVLATEINWKIPASGIVVVAGGTNSGKSTVVRGLIRSYLTKLYEETKHSEKKKSEKKESEKKKSSNRWPPHFLTIEDPVEKWLFTVDKIVNFGAVLNYTPRLLGRDCVNLQSVLEKDALRQTPALVYVGESRGEDLGHCLKFAGTGHLIITTTHASSLLESMSKVLTSVKAATPDIRAQFVPHILSIIHLKRVAFKDPNGSEDERILPAMWRHTIAGAQQLVADGLTAVLPHNSHSFSSLGRRYFAEKLYAIQAEASKEVGEAQKPASTGLAFSAMEDDLNG
jgi:Tfp pilus assembly pilus retraction ATPase PilT